MRVVGSTEGHRHLTYCIIDTIYNREVEWNLSFSEATWIVFTKPGFKMKAQ